MKAGLLGRKLGHSLSPQIHRFFGDYEYCLHEKEPDEVEGFLRERLTGAVAEGRDSTGGIDFLNVTIPYKQTVFALCDELTPMARKLGNVNFVTRTEDGRLRGDNTDAFGVGRLLDSIGADAAGMNCAILGAGGAALTARAVLEERGAKRVTFVRRGEEPARDDELIVNATPVGMFPDVDGVRVDISQYAACRAVLDLVYNPSPTRLVREARACGKVAADGMVMLIAQAYRAFQISNFRSQISDFKSHVSGLGSSVSSLGSHVSSLGSHVSSLGSHVSGLGSQVSGLGSHVSGLGSSVSSLGSHVSGLGSQVSTLFLYGPPASGKSTWAKKIAAATGWKLVDLDAEIVKATGRSIPEIFAVEGEAGFRKIEKRCLTLICGGETPPPQETPVPSMTPPPQETSVPPMTPPPQKTPVGNVTGRVVALGGGALLDPESRKLAEAAGRVVVLDCDLATLKARLTGGDRPLSADAAKLEALIAARKPHYDSFPRRVKMV